MFSTSLEIMTEKLT